MVCSVSYGFLLRKIEKHEDLVKQTISNQMEAVALRISVQLLLSKKITDRPRKNKFSIAKNTSKDCTF